jgi:hypothetical protein
MSSAIVKNEGQIYGGHSSHAISKSYNFYFDQSLDAAANEATADGKISSSEIDDVMDGAFDLDQMTEREARAFVAWADANYTKMSPEARKKYDLINATLEQALGDTNLKDKTNSHFAGHADKLALDKTAIDALKAKLAEIGAPPKSKPTEKPHADGMDSGGACGTPEPKSEPADPTPAAPEPKNFPSEASKMEIPNFANMDWDQILAFFRRLIGAKELDAKKSLNTLAEKLKAAQSKPATTEKEKADKAAEIGSIQQDIQDIQSDMKKIDEMTTMIVNLEKARHETLKFIIQNIGA